MKFVEGGPYIPEALVDAVSKGEAVFICGAGVSKRAGLPLFGELVECVYEALGELRETAEERAFQDRAYDRVLRALEKRIQPHGARSNRMRDAVVRALQPPSSALDDHFALLRISRDDEGRPRLLTTNFDTVFERAWHSKTSEKLPSYAGANLPGAKSSRDHGVLHLHGRIGDEHLGLDETDLVLTSADFGDAYLRSGWASRHVGDRLRCHALVLVGYGAEDAAVRLLLEALDADRSRFPDLKPVFAFERNDPQAQSEWEAKGVQPIVYASEDPGDHEDLYATLGEWASYTDDPDAYARRRLQETFRKCARDATAFEREQVVALLPLHGGGGLLAELNPDVSWIGPLQEGGLLSGKAGMREKVDIGTWIARRLEDPAAIQACVAGIQVSEATARSIERALEDSRTRPPEVFERAWRLIIRTARISRNDDPPWFFLHNRIDRGDLGNDVLAQVADIFRPRIRLSAPYRGAENAPPPEWQPSRLAELVHADMEPVGHVFGIDILDAWPVAATCEQDNALLTKLNLALEDALREAEDIERVRPDFDVTDWQVCSVSVHEQDKHSGGFYPIVRVIADVWDRLAKKDENTARAWKDRWLGSRFILARRLALYALTNQVFSADEAADALLALSDDDFWRPGARRETIKLMAERWNAFPEELRRRLEDRLLADMPRGDLAGQDGEPQQRQRDHDSQVFFRLSRIRNAGGILSAEAETRLEGIGKRHREWQASPDDRDDFWRWTKSGFVGPLGDISLLRDIPADRLIDEAFRIQGAEPVQQGDLWQALCASQPGRAIDALRADAGADRWRIEAWQGFLWQVRTNVSSDVAQHFLDLLLTIPEDLLMKFGVSAVHRLEDAWPLVEAKNDARWKVCSRLTDVAFSEHQSSASQKSIEDYSLDAAISSFSGALIDFFAKMLPSAPSVVDSGISPEIRVYFDEAINAVGAAGKLARVVLASRLYHLYWLDPAWTTQNLLPRFRWDHLEAVALWSARAYDQFGSPKLFAALREPFLMLFSRADVNEDTKETMTEWLVWAALSRRENNTPIDLDPREARRALRLAGAGARSRAAWFFCHVLEKTNSNERARKWYDVVKPTLQEIWPLDADLRDGQASLHLVRLAMTTGDEFPDAVESLASFIGKFETDILLSSIKKHDDFERLASHYPKPMLTLINAAVSQGTVAVQTDMREMLDTLSLADPELTRKAAFRRLQTLARTR